MQSVGVDDHKVPPNETDQVQPIDRGMGRQIKVYLGQLLDEWGLTTRTTSRNGSRTS